MRAYDVAAAVVDPELPMLTLADLGVLRSVEEREGRVDVAITPTYSGCPALSAMRDDLVRRLGEEGYDDVRVRVELDPPWSSDLITDRGRTALAEHGISPPGPAPASSGGPVPLTLEPTRLDVRCPRCGAVAERTSEFGPTPCTSLFRCPECREPFEHVKEL
ncbi:MAG TPA: 1,2-phenylacetyl-CoA epoxidase subunit PaaD [Nocardioides sp.]|uniref:1,2-phenylacetyl-CoA epoxidase subunit PaaD n=1 Tax=Nocardioides sp. TaxID=35761 RepID=UPI002C4C631F|nr:1,2-phenylacetyl-CoA epoxidase subunit PaaD [Nocardioides sp.]HTW17405.1 1,2-phenylacetyl-CoA epoxidase subunit PaaD [Nocardioides sp.]